MAIKIDVMKYFKVLRKLLIYPIKSKYKKLFYILILIILKKYIKREKRININSSYHEMIYNRWFSILSL